MKIGRFIFSTILVVFLFAGLQAADEYVADKSHTNIGFTVKHMVIATVPGKFNDYTIDFMFDANDLKNSSVKASIKTASIDTGDEKRDGHLRSPDFFDAEQHPEIIFVSSSVVKNGSDYVAKGTLTMRGVSKEIELPFSVQGPVQDRRGNSRIGVEASLTIDRQEYGISWSKSLDSGGLVVSDDVNIKLNLELKTEG